MGLVSFWLPTKTSKHQRQMSIKRALKAQKKKAIFRGWHLHGGFPCLGIGGLQGRYALPKSEPSSTC